MKMHTRGVSLVELLVALAILAILTAIAVPSFRAFSVSGRLTTQTNELLAAYQLARAEAIRLNTEVRLCRTANPGSNTCAGGNNTNVWTNWIVVRQANNAGAFDQVIRRSGIPANTVVRANAAITNNIISIRADGLARTAAGAPLNGVLQVCIAGAPPAENARTLLFRVSGVTLVRPNPTGVDCAQALP